MRKVTTALVTLGMASTMALGLGATPASAANPACGAGAYPPGSPFAMSLSPREAAMKLGATQAIAVYTHKGDKRCGGQRLIFQIARPGGTFASGRIVYTGYNGHGFTYYKALYRGTNILRYVWVTSTGSTVVSKSVITVA